MSAPIMLTKNFGSGIGAYTLTGATLAAIGAGFGTAETFGAGIWSRASFGGNVVRYKGKLYAWIADDIYQYDDVSAWTSVHTLAVSQGSFTGGYHTPLYVLNISGVPTLCGVYGSSTSGTVKSIKTTDGSTWSEATVNGANNFLGYGLNKTFVFQNKLYIDTYWSSGTFTHAVYDPATDVLTYVGTGSLLQLTSDFCAYKGRFFKLGLQADGKFHLQELVSSAFTDVILFPEVATTTNPGGYNFNSCLFVAPDGNMYAAFYCNNGTNFGICLHKVTIISGTPTDGGEISTAVLPASLAFTGNLLVIGTTNGGFFTCYDDQESSPGSFTSLIYIADSKAADASYAAYTFINESTPLSLIGVGGNVDSSNPNYKQGGGARTYVAGGKSIEIVMEEAAAGGRKLSYRAYGGGTVTISFYFKDPMDEVALTLCSLVSPSIGTITGGNTNTGVTADGSLQYVTWAFLSDGVTRGDQVTVTPRVA